MKRRIAFICAATMLSGCVQQQVVRNDLVGYAPQQLKIAGQRAEAPAHVSTVAFKELGDTKRGIIVERLIHETWDEACKPASLRLNGYTPNGASQWDVICKGSVIAKDYVVAIPEHDTDNARVLKCHAASIRIISCSIVGPATTAPTRTADAS